MNFKCQDEPLRQLMNLALEDRHSLLIDGPAGCGKTYMAYQYGEMLGQPDLTIQTIDPNVGAIREAINSCLTIQTPVLLCIENLDTGLPAASYTLLKFLEEPTKYVYIVVTCRNLMRVPDTIVSRSAVVNATPPIIDDLIQYGKAKDSYKLQEMLSSPLWRCATTFKDVDYIFGLNETQISFYTKDILTYAQFKDSISNMSWAFMHYADNSEVPIEFVVKYLMSISSDPNVKSSCIAALKDIAASRIGAHAIMCKLLFECKYGGG